MNTAITMFKLPALVVAFILMVSPLAGQTAPTPNDLFDKQISRDRFITVIEDDVANKISSDLHTFITPQGDWEDQLIDYQIHGDIFDLITKIITEHKFGPEIKKHPGYQQAEYDFVNRLVIDREKIKDEAEKRIGQKHTILKAPNVTEIYINGGKARFWNFVDNILPKR